MKFTNKGRQPKDNSRRLGVIADRKLYRREAALKRFSILPQNRWAADQFHKDGNSQRCNPEDYAAYVARKNVELDSLKSSLDAA